jgi:FkbM family methyltransferase
MHAEMFPTREAAALRQFESHARRTGRYRCGRIALAGMDIGYVDAASAAVQWKDIFVERTFEFSPRMISPRILDCGANIGLAALWLKQRFPAARITAFEPDRGVCETLRQNLTRNGAADVEVIEAAVWKSDATVRFRREGADAGAVHDVAADTPGDLVSVRAVRLRDWVARERIDLLKLDVEGAELDVLLDVADVLSNVQAVHVEIHDFDPARRLLPECLLLLERAGFTYALGHLLPAAWRPAAGQDGPFARTLTSWITLVRAWRPAGERIQ